MNDSDNSLKGALVSHKSPPFFIFGGWCPHLTGLEKATKGRLEFARNFEDVFPEEKISIVGEFTTDFISTLSCGIPEKLFAHAIIEWGQNGLFLIKCQFTSDWEKKEDKSADLDNEEIKTLCQNVIYRLIKDQHHIHIHHDEEDDNLLSLLYLGQEDDVTNITLLTNDLRTKIVKAIYCQYSRIKPNKYTISVKTLLGNSEPRQSQLEEAIRILYQGIGESTFGIAFLGMHGKDMFSDAQINTEHIKMESAMRSLETLKGRYTFDYMKKNKPASNITQVAELITRAVAEGMTKAVI